jgi:ankyrin repeat protein
MASPEILNRIAAGRTDLILDLPLEIALAASADSDHHPPLVWAAHYGDVSALKVLLDRGAPRSVLGPNLGLMGAAFHNHWRLVQFLIERGADPRLAEEDTGETPLHAALSRESGHAQHQTTRVLIQAGADPAAKTLNGRETGCFMRDARTRGETPLHRAAAFANGETIDALLETGVPVDIADAWGDSPLSWGSWARRPDTILRRLCFGPHRIRIGRQPMRDGLVGEPLFTPPPGTSG